VLYLRPDADDDGLAFGRASDTGTGFVSVPVPDRFNAGGGKVTSEYLGSEFGRYRMTFQGMARRGFGGEHVQVMAVDRDSLNHCAIEGWDVESVDVRCFHYDGSVARPSSTEYVALFIRRVALPVP
jgi:hypothetical protein